MAKPLSTTITCPVMCAVIFNIRHQVFLSEYRKLVNLIERDLQHFIPMRTTRDELDWLEEYYGELFVLKHTQSGAYIAPTETFLGNLEFYTQYVASVDSVTDEQVHELIEFIKNHFSQKFNGGN